MRLISISAMLVVCAVFSCTKHRRNDGSSFSSIETLSERALTNVTDVASAARVATDLKYLDGRACVGNLQGNEEVVYVFGSKTLDISRGYLKKTDGGFYFQQTKDNGLRPPGFGVSDNPLNAISSWDFASFQRLICMTAFHIGGMSQEAKYDKVQARIVDIRLRKDDVQVAHKDIMALQLSQAKNSAEDTILNVYLDRNLGVVAMEYQEKVSTIQMGEQLWDAGPFRYVNVYLAPQGGFENDPRVAKCKSLNGVWSANEICFIEDHGSSESECGTRGGEWIPPVQTDPTRGNFSDRPGFCRFERKDL